MVRRASAPTFVGRAAELSQLREAFARAEASQPTLVLVVGEAGVGKTRLVAEFTAGLPARIAAGACAQIGEDGPPYGPLLPLLRATGALPGADEPSSSLVGSTARAWFFQSVVDRIEMEAHGQPIVAVVEDMQWSDRATRDVLDFIVRCIPPSRLLVVATLRSEELAPGHPVLGFFGEIGRHERVERLALGGLDPTASEDLLRSLPDAEQMTGDVADIVRRADGNPYFLEELAAAARRGERMPATVRDIVEARLADLASGARAVAAAMAVAGGDLAEADLAFLTGLGDDEVAGLAQDAINRRLIERHKSAATYRFRHALIGEVLYGSLRPDERRRLHRLAAERLDRSSEPKTAESLAELARHLDRAGDPAAGLPASIAAARAAELVYAYPEAARQWARARLQEAALLRTVGDGRPTSADLLQRHAIAATRAGDHVAAIELERQLLPVLEVRGDRSAVAACRGRLAIALWDAGVPEFMEMSFAAVDALATTPQDRIHATVLAGHARLLMLESRLSEASVIAARAIEAAVRFAPELEGGARITLGASEAGLGQTEQGLANLRLGLDLARRSGQPDDIARGLLNLDYAFWSAGLLDEALELAKLGLAEVRGLGLQSAFGGPLLANLGESLFLSGDWDEAARVFAQVAVEDEGAMVGLDVRTSSAELAVGSGRWEEARRLLADGRAIAERVQGSTAWIRLGLVEASLAAWEARWDDGLANVDQAIASVPDPDHATFAPRIAAVAGRIVAEMAETARARRNAAGLDEARRLAERYRSLVEDLPAADTPDELPAARAFRLLALAELTRLDERPNASAWAAAAEAFGAMHSPYPVAYCRLHESQARLAGHESRAVAARRAEEARTIAARLGAAPLLREIDAFTARARLPMASAGETHAVSARPTHGLTPREVEVVALLATGLTNRQIAETLFITEKTAGLHVSNILSKFGVANRVEAAGTARRLGLVGPPD